MQRVFPDYYKKFKCISSKCRHNCCIGWEIDIDPDTAEFYRSVPDEFGGRLKDSISEDGEPHFILGDNERCPFLNSDNLCDIIITLGENRLCTICAEHPRFHNELPGRIESGIGLCCEEAARLILTVKEPMLLEITGECAEEDDIILLRDRIIAALQDRSRTISQRITDMLTLCSTQMPERTFGEWCSIFLDLEQLDGEWTALLTELAEKHDQLDYNGFDRFMAERQTEYEQLLVYIIYRHFANAPDLSYTPSRARFAALIYELIRSLGAMIWSGEGDFTLEQQLDLARMFSSEIEYSDENLSFLLDDLDF